MTNDIAMLERISDLVENYLYRLGKAWVAFYIFPNLENHYDFARFVRLFMMSLKRAICCPGYLWSYDSNKGCYYLILLVNGCFRHGMNDITDTAQRIWNRYSPFPIQFIAEMLITSETKDQDKTKILEIINGMQFVSSTPQRLLPPHHRTFACSTLYYDGKK